MESIDNSTEYIEQPAEGLRPPIYEVGEFEPNVRYAEAPSDELEGPEGIPLGGQS